MHKKFLVLFMF